MTITKLLGNPKSVQIKRVRKETETATTLEFELPYLSEEPLPGQFIMVWVPGIDEIPMSLSFWKRPRAQITSKAIGESTNRIAHLEVGQWIGVRGPFGRSFSLDARKALVVGGGIGMAPLRFLVYSLLDRKTLVTLLIGARSKEDLVLYDFKRIKHRNLRLMMATDDGSVGRKGYVTEVADEVIETDDFDVLYTCGPEVMMAKLHRLALRSELRFEASLERYMKCGCGICGTCGMDPTGELVCIDGPVFSGKRLSSINDFGRYKRNHTGKKVSVID